MLNISVLMFIISSVVCQEIVGINYTFGDDFYWSFDYKTCQNAARWHLLHYTNTKTGSENSFAVLSLDNSCASSFFIDFLPDSVLVINVYLQLRTLRSGLAITVLDEFNVPVLNYFYHETSADYISGWNKLVIPISRNFTGYVKFQGRNTIEEIVLIDSFKYIIHEKSQKTYENINNVNENLKEIDESEWMLTKNIRRTLEIADLGLDDDDVKEGSGDDYLTTPSEIPTESPPTAPSSNFWNIWTILLVSVFSLTLIGVITISAYHCGKRRGREDSDVIIESQELPRPLRLPRINNIYSGSFSERFNRY